MREAELVTVAAIIQARMTSSRLPGKVLLPAAGRPMLAHQVDRVRRAALVDTICIATTANTDDDRIADLARSEGIECFRGSEHDVLDRFAKAAASVQASLVVRLTGDCPLTDPGLVDDAIDRFYAACPALDYLSNGILPTWPIGLDIEVMTMEALQTAAREAVRDYDREHVTPFIYDRPERFRLANIACPEPAAEHRWTLDEPADYELIRRIIETLLSTDPGFGWRDILTLMSDHPDWQTINSNVKQRTGRPPG